MLRNVAVIQRKTIGFALTIAGFLAIAALTLTPNPGGARPSASLCLVCGSYGGTDVVLNILLFIPFGFGMRLSGLRPRRAFVIAALTSLAIELLQIHVVVGRDASLGDLVSNSLGGAIGIGLASCWRSWLLPNARVARRLMSAGLALWLLILAGSAWGARPSLTRLTYVGHWASLTGPGPLFTGKVIDVSVGHAPLPWNVIANSGDLRRWLLAGSPLRATVTLGSPIDGLVPITRITDISRTEIIMLGQQGRDLVFRMRTHASDLRLRDPAVRIENAFPSATADAQAPLAQPDTLRIAGGYTGRSYRVSVIGPRMAASREIRLSPGLGWSFFLPFSYASGRVTVWLTALWLGGLLLPIGFWAARAADKPRRRVRGARGTPPAALYAAVIAAAAVSIAIGLGLVPLIFGELPVQWWAWVACAAGAIAGAAFGHLTLAAEDRGSSRGATSGEPRVTADELQANGGPRMNA
ncbi:MAG TPA: VanZ family protein [Gemmatimonadaceae bacterium]|nr:VanZ family protein [Gemmatimonadaceae bacterium]